MIRRVVAVNTDIEKKIIIGLIISTEFCKSIMTALRVEYFTITYARHIIRWVSNYFFKYQQAPNKHIQDIFQVEKEKMSPGEATIIEEFLSSLSHQYEQEPDFNHEYLRDQALTFFRQRGVEITYSKAKTLIDMNKLDEAETVLRDYQKISKSVSKWINPFDESVIERFFAEEEKEFFKFEGKLGDLLGNWRRGDLVGIMAPSKRGKSWWLLGIAIQGILSKLKVVYINLEMDEGRVVGRIYKRLTALGDYNGEYIYPCFDCKKNQIGSCTRKERASRKSLYEFGQTKPLFSSDLHYKICNYCREHHPKEYEPASWFFQDNRKKLSYMLALSNLKSIKEFVGDRLREITYPAYEASMSIVKSDLEALEYAEDFVPDVIVIDYADILAPDGKEQGRDISDIVWKGMKNVAMKKHCLVVTATQSNRASFDKRSVKGTDVGEDIRKIQHVDRMVMLSQTPVEKDRGIMRVSVIQRHEHFNENFQIQVLQNFSLGQPFLDSENIGQGYESG